MSIDRDEILKGYITQYGNYSTNTSGVDAKKILKFAGRNFDVRERADVGREVVVFSYENATSDVEVDDDNPTELNQNVQAMVYLEQADNHSAKQARYERMLDLTDDLINWSLAVTPSDIDSSVWTVSLTSIGSVQEQEGYLSCEVNFRSRINLL